MEGNIKQQVEQNFTKEDNATKNKLWALMLFNTELELGISNTPNKWVNTHNIFFKNGLSALNAYSNIPNPASQLIDAKTPEELINKMEDMVQNFKDPKWLEEELYPTL